MWKTIKDFTNYEINEEGQVRNKKTQKILKPSLSNQYLRINLRKNKKTYQKYIHRLVAENFLEQLDGFEVNHKDKNKLNNNVNNLEWISHKANVQHAYAQGIDSRLTKIRVEFIDGTELIFKSRKECAKYFKVDESTIRDYIKHKLTPARKIQAEFYII